MTDFSGKHSAKLNVWVVGTDLDMPETWIYSLLAERGVNLTVFYSANMRADLLSHLKSSGADCIELNYHGRLDMHATKVIRNELSHRPCDIIYCTLNKPLAAALRAVRGYPGIKVVAYRGTMGHLTRWDPSSWLTFFHPRLDHIVAVSDAVRRYMVEDKKFPSEMVTRIYKGHDVTWYGGDGAEIASSGMASCDGHGLNVGFVGQIRHVKGVEYLLDAMKLIPADLNVRLTLIGGISEKYLKRRIEHDVAADSRIEYLGYRKDATRLVRQLDVTVMPTVEREGLAKSVIESMSQGVPAIVSDVGGLPEIVEDGKSGFVVPPRNAEAIADAIKKLALDPVLLQSLRLAAKKRIMEKFDYRKSADAFLALFSRLTVNSSVPNP